MKEKLKQLNEQQFFIRLVPIFLLVVMAIGFNIATDGKFGDVRNLKLIITQAVIIGTVATGAVFIFGTGNVSIALGATTAITAAIMSKAYLATESVAVMILTAIVVATLIMVVTAVLSTVLRVSVMFVSIVVMVLFQAILQTILGAGTLTLPYEMTASLTNANFHYIAFAAYFILCAVLFHYTAIGRSIKFLGSNKICAEQSGIFLNKYLMIAFAVSGVGIGLAAIMTGIRTGTIGVGTASSLNMDVVLAIVLGGMSVFGGTRSYVYAGALGAITVTLLNNGLLMVGISPTILQLVRGIFFLTFIFAGQKRPDRLPDNEI
ncbi:MAG TPA: ABC transporter permease [Proteiniclasticum sp.]|uniref:Autoinducer 2 import system permease protein LsrD n=1 Tax=Proteiniclasticum ruminis TaxID=398199 RepID=A0A1I5E0A5_9CLOT|nr:MULTISPECIES: ABC transporter permease [Proteiniclasticum]SFO04899.1 ribose transport system permease protein [Proteiniclasticum ruminis]HBW14541.1 ABC transporter permease [Proteiniclasticum sp.]